jgi:hypothetical protein
MKPLIFFFFLLSSLSAQNIKIVATDTLFLPDIPQGYHTHAYFHRNQFIVTQMYNGITYFDTLGRKIKKINLTPHKGKNDLTYHSFEHHLFPYQEGFISAGGWGYTGIVDSNGSTRLLTNIWKNYQKQYINGVRYVELGHEFSSPPVITWHDTIIVPAFPIVYGKLKKLPRYDRVYHFALHDNHELEVLPSYPLFKMYSINTDLKGEKVPLHDKKGERMRFLGNIGHKDSLWLKTVRQGAMYQDAHYQAYDLDSLRKQIICGIAVRPEMQVYDLSGKLIRIFGERGRHLTATDTPVKIYKQDFIDSLKTKSLGEMQRFSADYASTKMWINTSYLQLKYDAVYNRTYRMYVRPVPLPEAEIYRMESSKDESIREACDSLGRLRPLYLQIYDHNDGDRLIYDEAVPAPFHILEVKGDTLWAVAGVSDKGLKIVKYVVRKK